MPKDERFRRSCQRIRPTNMIGTMASIHKFYDCRVSLVLGTGALVVHRVSEHRVVIPLAVIAEVHRPEPRSLDLLLTDGEVQHIDCIDSNAMAEFAATLTPSLPE
ncbi:hypothetical protein AQF52_0214 [Streptomyces venezuelae]|nr:hypothetical protein AQF52_0214 [Streptomyces venezuelae]